MLQLVKRPHELIARLAAEKGVREAQLGASRTSKIGSGLATFQCCTGPIRPEDSLSGCHHRFFFFFFLFGNASFFALVLSSSNQRSISNQNVVSENCVVGSVKKSWGTCLFHSNDSTINNRSIDRSIEKKQSEIEKKTARKPKERAALRVEYYR
jgi:hypothetical protein